MQAGLAGAAGLNLVVNDTSDALDSSPGDGACATSAGTCTLRAAIQEANASPGADVIQVPSGTYELAIPPLNQNDITTGDLDITDSLTISGAGAGSTIIDGGTPPAGAPPRVQGLDRLFEVLVDGGTVAFSDLTFSDGYAAEYGGAVANNSTATVTVSASTLTGNVADKVGGAIDNHLGGAVHVQNSTLSENVAFESGSALNNNRDGALTVTNSTVSSNSAAAVGLDETLVGAGAISNNAELDATGTITVSESQILGNAAGGSRAGAAISNDGAGTVTVDQTTFSKNRAEVDGGAIFNGAGEVTVTDSTFSENAGESGGAIYNGVKDGRMTVTGSTFSLNTASAGGGAIASSGTGILTVLDSTFSKNSAEHWGGAILNDDKGSAAIVNSMFSENSGLNGGGFANEGTGLVTVENSTFTKNAAFVTAVLASGEGGGVHSNSVGEVVITGGAFTENKAQSGGGFSNEGGGQVTVTRTRFSANKATEQGGGILIQSGAVRMLDIDVIGNVSESELEGGGGISYAGDKLVSLGESAAIENSRVRDNKAKSSGGGIDSRGDGPLAITTTSITGNTAAAGGGIHHVGDAPLEVTRSTLSGNFAEGGGGAFTDGDGETLVENTTISRNRAGQFGGGLLVSSRLTIRSSTVTGNNAASGGGINNGGGDLVGDGSAFLANTIVSNNPTGGNCAGAMTSLGGNLENANTCQLIELSDQPGTDPLLSALADNGGPTQTHALLADSPAQEKAVCTEVEPCPPVDQRGVARPLFAGVDVGAYESDLVPSGGGGAQACAGRTERPLRSDFDSWVSESGPGANFASDSILKVRSQDGANQRTLVHFALPPVPPGCRLVGATLRLYSSSATDGRTLEALRIASDWSEFGVTWDSQPGAAGQAAPTQSGVGFLEWDVLDQTRDMYALGQHGFLIQDGAENETGDQALHSAEKGTDRPPELVLIFDDPDAPPRPGVCPTTPQSLSADGDSWISEGSPSNNFGNDSTLKVKSQLGYNARALVRFTLPALPAGCTGVASATLRLDAQSGTADRVLQALQVASAWSETDVTWSNQPTTTGPAVTTPSGEGPLEWDVTARVLDMYGSHNHGFLIRDADENGVGEEQTFNSRLKLNDGPPELVLVFDGEGRLETTIDSAPPALTNESEATFAFSSDQTPTFECSLDGAAFDSCTSPHPLEGLTEGAHRFEVRATRGVTEADLTPASHSWTVDLTAPAAEIGDRPADPTKERSASLSFSGTDNLDEAAQLSFQCRLDHPASDWDDCSSPQRHELLAEGSHTFELRALDRAGNVGSAAGYSWTIDLTAPESLIDSGPADPDKSTSASFGFSADEEGSFACSLDGGDFVPCSSPAEYHGLAPVAHVFRVRAIDQAGNVEPDPSSYAWTVDTTAPNSTIGQAPRDPTKQTSAQFEFTADEESSFACSLDGGAYTACESPYDYPVLEPGRHVFRVQATDRAGNQEAEPAQHAWTVDVSEPETALGDRPPPTTTSTSATFTFVSEAGATFECKLDAEAFARCESPKPYAGLAVGAHRFQVRATDTAGNVDSSPATHDWTIEADTQAPESRIDRGPADPSNQTGATFSFSGSDNVTAASSLRFQCRLDSAADIDWEACTSPHTYAGPLAHGRHSFEVRALDAADNVEPDPSIYSWLIDATAPTTTIEEAPVDPTRQTTATFRFLADEASTFQCSLDNGPYGVCTSPYNSPVLQPGRHTFRVQATDAVGNTGAPASHAWTVDTSPPATTIGAGPKDPTNETAATFSFAGSDNVTAASSLRFQCRLDSAADTAWAGCSSPQSYAGPLASGRHNFEVRALDEAGNTDATPASHAWTVDTTPPQTTIDSGPAARTTSTSASFRFSASEPGSKLECSLDGAGFASCTSPREYSGLAVGDHNFQVRATDAAGNTDASPASYSWTIEAPGPCAGLSTVTLGAEADSWIIESSPSSNYGRDSVVKVDTKAGANARALFRFALPTIPASCHVLDAKLRLYASSYKEGRTLYALQLAAGWTESGVNWSNLPTTTGPAAAALSPSTSRYVEWSVTSQVQSMYSTRNDGFLIRDSVEGGNGLEQAFHSREKGTDNPPQLVITFG